MTDSTFDRLEKRLTPPAKVAKPDRRRLLLVVGVGLAGGVLGAAAGRLTALEDNKAATDQAAREATAAQFVILPEMLVNLRGTASVRLMKIGVTLQVSADNNARLAAMAPVLVDGLQSYLRGLDEHDLEGRLGVETLRTEILRRVRLLADPLPVEGVLLRTLILQ